MQYFILTFLHNIKILCPSISPYVTNYYSSPTDLYIQDGRSIKSEEGTTQGDPTAMAIYALGITPLLAWLSKKSNEGNSASASKHVAFADDLNGIGTVESLKMLWSLLEGKGKKIGYYVNAKRSYLIVKEQYKDKAKEIFEDTSIKISTEGHRHLGSVIGSKQFSENYISSLISQWCEEITELSLIAKTHPQAAYSAFTSGYKHKFTYFMRTIENIENFMLPLDKVIKLKLIPALFNDFQISEKLRSLIALPCKLGGMGIINPTEIANEEYVNSRKLTKKLTSLIIQQEHSYTVSEEEIKKIKSKIQKKRMEKQQRTLSSLRDKMSYMEIRLNDIAQEQGSSS